MRRAGRTGGPAGGPLLPRDGGGNSRGRGGAPPTLGPPPPRAPGGSHPAINYELFNSSNVSIRHWSWNYRSCWHQACPPVDTHCWVWIRHPLRSTTRRRRRGGVAIPRRCLTGPRWYWAIYAPAACLGSGSRFSGSLSGIKPQFPVTREGHCGTVRHSLWLIGQKLDQSGSGAHRVQPLCYRLPRARGAASRGRGTRLQRAVDLSPPCSHCPRRAPVFVAIHSVPSCQAPQTLPPRGGGSRRAHSRPDCGGHPQRGTVIHVLAISLRRMCRVAADAAPGEGGPGPPNRLLHWVDCC